MLGEHKNTFQKIFITGLLILIPVAATIFILIFMFNLLDGWLAPAGGQILRALGVHLPPDLKHIPGFGILATFLLIVITGLVASNYLGRQLLKFGERIIRGIPIVNSIYSAMRQLVTAFSGTGANAFKTVVLIEYPRKGIWTVAFLTTPSLDCAKRLTKKSDLVNVFYPTTPNPTTGFFMMIPRRDIQVLPISIEEGVKIIATVGLIQSNSQEAKFQSVDKPGLELAKLPTGKSKAQHRTQKQ